LTRKINMRYRVLPYRQGSRGAKSLATALGGKVLKLEGSTWQPHPEDVVINWGNTKPIQGPARLAQRILNDPESIKTASNKLNFFDMMHTAASDLIPQYWSKREDIPNDVFPIVCRTVLAGHSGEGIVIANNAGELVDAPLYVQYVKKKEEYRVHVGKRLGDDGVHSVHIIAVQRKARRTDTPNEEVNWQVRNLAGGFIFQRNGFVCPEAVLSAAKRAIESTQLDFGAVDVIWNEQQEKPYVLEINTAPGLEGSTVDDYRSFFTAT
jgi:hypothetical protein